MVALLKRMRTLKSKLFNIRLGPGAAVLPPEVTKIHMDFALKINDGHAGPRKFWRNCLPRLKYHNPAVPMTVNRTTNQQGPALMTIHFTNSDSSQKTPSAVSPTTSEQSSTKSVAESTPGGSDQRTEIINMKNRTDSEILNQLLSITKAKPVDPTPEDLVEIKKLEEFKAKSDADKLVSLREREKKRKQEAMLAQARGDLAEATNA